MIEALALLLGLQLIGEVLVRLLDLPVPGPVIGMTLLLFGLILRGQGVPKDIGAVANSLLSHLSMLFIPAGVGVVLYLSVIVDHWAALGTSLVLSTLITIAVTGWLMKKLGPSDRSAKVEEGKQ